MPPKKQSPPVQQTAIGDGNVQIAGDHNTVNQTIIQKFFNIFKSDAETVDQRNRRIMLGHVENFWVKGILEKSLHGAALLELGIKEDPDALNYPWAIKREANKETLPAGTSMLEIFQGIGLGRSLLILGAPGSGKTTMLLELTRQLIERAREDVTEPIPVLFNLSSWAEKLTLADWLARELNVIYTIPKKIAPTWVKENKMLLLLDGLDEVRQESRGRCVDAINQFRKENGLTSMAVCSRIQDYSDLKTRLSFDGAIEIQPLISNQVDEYFSRFGEGLTGIRQVLEKDIVLREMAETPLFLSIMTLAYRNTQSKDILLSENLEIQRKHLFDTYIERMFERPERSNIEKFTKKDVLHWLSWLAKKMIEYNQIPYFIENMQSEWIMVIDLDKLNSYSGFRKKLLEFYQRTYGKRLERLAKVYNFEIADTLTWNWRRGAIGFIIGSLIGLIIIVGVTVQESNLSDWRKVLDFFDFASLMMTPLVGLAGFLINGLSAKPMIETTYPGQRLVASKRNLQIISLLTSLPFVIFIVLLSGGLTAKGIDWLNLEDGLAIGLLTGVTIALLSVLRIGGMSYLQHKSLRRQLSAANFLPKRLVPFLNYCAERIFLRRVGGGYIFVHRLLMDHFAAMYVEEEN